MNEVIQGLIRHGLTWAGGSLMLHGFAFTADQQNLVTGALMTLVGVAWSVWSKRAKA